MNCRAYKPARRVLRPIVCVRSSAKRIAATANGIGQDRACTLCCRGEAWFTGSPAGSAINDTERLWMPNTSSRSGPPQQSGLVVSAYSADFVWRDRVARQARLSHESRLPVVRRARRIGQALAQRRDDHRQGQGRGPEGSSQAKVGGSCAFHNGAMSVPSKRGSSRKRNVASNSGFDKLPILETMRRRKGDSIRKQPMDFGPAWRNDPMRQRVGRDVCDRVTRSGCRLIAKCCGINPTLDRISLRTNRLRGSHARPAAFATGRRIRNRAHQPRAIAGKAHRSVSQTFRRDAMLRPAYGEQP